MKRMNQQTHGPKLRYMGENLEEEEKGKKKKKNEEGLNPREQAAARRCSLSLLNSRPYGRHLSWFWR